MLFYKMSSACWPDLTFYLGEEQSQVVYTQVYFSRDRELLYEIHYAKRRLKQDAFRKEQDKFQILEVLLGRLGHS